MEKIIINGKFMEERMQGIVRYSRELLNSLDNIIEGDLVVELAVPLRAYNIPAYKNIRVIQLGKKRGILWEQTELRKYVKQSKEAICVNLCNVTPLFVQPGITVIHDIMYRVNPSHYKSFRNRVSRLWHMYQYSYIAKHESRIITISEFCKNEIEKYYPKSKGRIDIVPDAWQHVLKFSENPDWKSKYPYLKENEFFFSLATRSKNKNGKWILEAAKQNPQYEFAIGGKYYETDDDQIPPNVHMLGYISDDDACSLMKHCRAFIFPSIYEGFGLPPLEALALGTDVISSNSTSLPEVLSDSVYYIDPYDSNVNFEKLLSGKVGKKENALDKFSWDKSARILLETIKNN